MTTTPEQQHDHDLAMAVAVAWGISGATTDSELDEIASQLLTELTELRNELPSAPAPDILSLDEDLTDRTRAWHREVTIHRAGAQAATNLVQAISTRPEGWPETLHHTLKSHCHRHGRPVLVAIVDTTTRLAAAALDVIARENDQDLAVLLEESLPPWAAAPRRRSGREGTPSQD